VQGHSEWKVWNADIPCTYTAPAWQCNNVCPRTAVLTQANESYLIPSSEPWSHSEQLPPLYLLEELVRIMALQQ
jgi:hypothetical protein